VKIDWKDKSVWQPIVRGAQKSLVIAGALMFASLLVFFGLGHISGMNIRGLQNAHLTMAEVTEKLAVAQENKSYLEQHGASWKQWNADGLIGQGARAEWFEALSNLDIAGVSRPELTLAAAESIPDHAGAYRHELLAVFTQAVETEPLKWMYHALSDVKTYGRVDALVFESGTGEGLTAHVSISLFHYDDKLCCTDASAQPTGLQND